MTDSEEQVTIRVLDSLTTMMQLGLLTKENLWDIFDAILGLLCHPNIWIRQSTASVIANIAQAVPHADLWCCLFPVLRRLLQADVSQINEQQILESSTAPVSLQNLLPLQY